MSQKLSLSDLPIKGECVLMRVDFNVPQDEKGMITDDSRIVAALPSIQYVLDQGGSVVLMSHLGRPKGVDPKFTLKPCAERLAKLLGRPVEMASDCVGPEVEKKVNVLKPGQVLLMENLRFHQGEENPESDPAFVQALAKNGTLYVNDAFGTAHRAHASTATIARFFPGKAAAGFLLKKEVDFLGQTLEHPARPFVALIGGAKISTKIGVLKALLRKVDALLVGGAMAYTFLKAQGYAIGSSLMEEDALGQARDILGEALSQKVHLFLPVDLMIADVLKAEAKTRIVTIQEGIPLGWQGVDIGPQTIALFTKELQKGKTLLWNGPVGVFEITPFSRGTEALARTLAGLDAVTIVGGGDSAAAVHKWGLSESLTHVSTGGGASLEYLEFGTLPGIDALSAKF